MSKKKVAGLEALKKAKPKKQKLAKKKVISEKVIFSLHLPKEDHERLREVSFYERQSMTKLLLEGLNMLFEKKGIK